jgi:hypothetical protein
MLAGARRALRLAFAMQRLELMLLVGAALVLAAGMLLIAWQVRVVRAEELACFAAAPPPVEGSLGSPCPQFMDRRDLLDRATLALGAAALIAPFALGLFLGVPIVARVGEGGTAPIAWSLSPSRRRWLLGRAAPVLLLVALAAVLIGAAGEVLMRAAPWNEDIDASFDFYGARGALVPARALAVAGLALLVGALLPRQLAAVLVAAGLVIAFAVGLSVATDTWMREAAVPVPVGETQGASRIFDMAFRDDASGALMSLDAYYAAHPDAGMNEAEEPPGMTMVAYVVPGSAYDTFVLRESALLLGGAALGLTLAALVVGVRRP